MTSIYDALSGDYLFGIFEACLDDDLASVILQRRIILELSLRDFYEPVDVVHLIHLGNKLTR